MKLNIDQEMMILKRRLEYIDQLKRLLMYKDLTAYDCTLNARIGMLAEEYLDVADAERLIDQLQSLHEGCQ